MSGLMTSYYLQTVACFPFFGGVVEMGVTELVAEDMNLIEHIKASFLDNLPQTIVPDIFLPNAILDSDMDLARMELDHDYLDAIEECDELDSLSPNNSTSKVATDQIDDSFMITGGASQVQSWHFLDEDFSNCVHNSSDCISQTFELSRKAKPALKIEKHSNQRFPCPLECTKLQSRDSSFDDLHYQSVISTLLKSSDQFSLGPCFGCSKKGSSFGKWNQGVAGRMSWPRNAMSQVMLKKALFEVGEMHSKLDVPKFDQEEIDAQHLPPVTEPEQQNVLNERFLALQSLVPSIDKADKAMLLDATITYLKELEKRVQQLESSKESTDLRDKSIPKGPQDTVEHSSDNYETDKTSSKNNPTTNKRKASHMEDQTELQIQTTSKTSKASSSDNVYVSAVDDIVMIEMRCCWRECLLLKVMDVMSSLSLDSHSVESSTANGILQLTIKSKFKGSSAPSVGVIRQKLQKMIVQST
ncbi:unnamed protein product [Rhodiola kirilowii]